LLDLFAKWWDVKQTILPPNNLYSCAIVLGGYGSESGNGEGYFNGTSDRFIQAIKLKTEGKVAHLLISGGSSRLLPTDFRESDWVFSQLKDFKISDSNILIENQSRNSFENAMFSKKILNDNNLQPPYLLITSAFHMRRALYIYNNTGLDVIPFPCNYIAGRKRSSIADVIPSASTLANWEFYIKEIVGYGVYGVIKK
jgi:uncharacterized SAM-binding protein YcdF (DUF218 family)